MAPGARGSSRLDVPAVPDAPANGAPRAARARAERAVGGAGRWAGRAAGMGPGGGSGRTGGRGASVRSERLSSAGQHEGEAQEGLAPGLPEEASEAGGL